MQATSSSFRGSPQRRTGLILAAVLTVAVLAAGAALLQPPSGATGASSSGSEGASISTPPVGGVDFAAPRDPSVPSAASVFQGKVISPEEPVDGF